jgi:branched-chain amino acid transport system ATP-binding protein
MISVKSLKKYFGGNTAIDNLSLAIPRGIITGLIGPNGAGKSTLVNLLTGMKKIDGGSVVVSDTELESIRPENARVYGVSRTFQQVRLFLQMSVLDNILLALTERSVFSALFERHTDYHRNQAKDILETVDLWHKRNSNVENLSFGQRKLLEIGRAVAADTETIFFDEPFAGLFPEIEDTVKQVIEDLKHNGKTIVLIEHDMEIIADLCEHVIVLDAGELLTEGSPEAVLEDEAVKDAYLGT